MRLEVGSGETVLIPAGWPHAVVTPQDTMAVGGNFLQGLDFRWLSAASNWIELWYWNYNGTSLGYNSGANLWAGLYPVERLRSH